MANPDNIQLQIAAISGGGQIPLDQVRGSGGAGVASLNALTGDLLLVSGDGSIVISTPIPSVVDITTPAVAAAAAAQTSANNAQGTANTGVTNAANAQSTADGAVSVNIAQNATIAEIEDDIGEINTVLGSLGTVYQTIANPSRFSMSAGQELDATLSDNATTTSTVVQDFTHNSTGTTGPGFASDHTEHLQADSGNNQLATTIRHAWATATDGNESAEIAFIVKRNGGDATRVKVSGDDTSAPLEIIGANSGDVNLLLSPLNGHDSTIRCTGGGNHNFALQLDGGGYLGLVVGASTGYAQQESAGNLPNVGLGNIGIVDNAATGGFVFLPQSEISGPPTGVPALASGIWAHKAAVFINKADGKIWANFGGSDWRYAQFNPASDLPVQLLNAALIDADASLAVATASEWTASPSLLTATRTLTLSTAGCITGDTFRIVNHLQTGANTLVIVNGGVGGGTLMTFPVTQARVADFTFDGVNFVLGGTSRLTV